MTASTKLRRKALAMHRRVREWRMVAKGLMSTRHPVLAHLIPIRRCNLDCAYCNEYDDSSKPVPIETMHRRIDRLAALGTSIVTISGGGTPTGRAVLLRANPGGASCEPTPDGQCQYPVTLGPSTTVPAPAISSSASNRHTLSFRNRSHYQALVTLCIHRPSCRCGYSPSNLHSAGLSGTAAQGKTG